jgi:hypothetical protein
MLYFGIIICEDSLSLFDPNIKYDYKTIKERIEYLNETKKDIYLSVQYGGYMLLTEDNEILLRLDALIKDHNENR